MHYLSLRHSISILTNCTLSCLYLIFSITVAASPTQQRIDKDIAAGKAIVVQIIVALADNKNQWIVPVPESLGNGQELKSNLYWGALYGVKTYLTRKAGWIKLDSLKPANQRILERLILKKLFHRNGHAVDVFLVADAWDGRYIMESIEKFMRFNAGDDQYEITYKNTRLHAGGSSHLIAYIGHNALMDYFGARAMALDKVTAKQSNPANDAIVLACKSRPYFQTRLEKIDAYPLLLTTGLMAPEAYSLDAAISEWIKGSSDTQVRNAAAKSYNKFQKTGIKAAKHLFGAK